jgi:hypothetical protein
MDSKEVMLLITGHSKAGALQQTIEGGVSHLCTCSVFQLHPNTVLVVDEPATDDLKVKTVRHFKAVMAIDRELTASLIQNQSQGHSSAIVVNAITVNSH